MIKINANISKKVPIAGMDYSSQSFMAGLEVEISDSADPSQVKERIREVYQLLEESINEQIASHQCASTNETCTGSNRGGYRNNYSQNRPQPGSRSNRSPQKDNNNSPASQAQLKAIDAIAADRGLSGGELSNMLQDNFRKSSVSELSLREASMFITLLKDIRNAS